MSSFPCKHLNSGPIFIHFGCLILSFKHWDTGRISTSIGIMILSLETLEFWLYFYTHWNSYLPLADNIGILSLFLQASEFWSYSFKHLNSEFDRCNSGSFLSNIGILISFFHCKHWNSCPILRKMWILVCFLNIAIPILSFQTLEFWPYVLYTLGVWSY